MRAERASLPARTELLVVGGGPAGLLAAEAAAARGRRVVVVERQRTIAETVRTSGAMSIAAMRRFAIPRELYHPIETVRIVSPGREASFRYPEPVMCVIDVRGVYRFLADRAHARGAEIVTAASAQEPLLEGGRVVGCVVEHDSLRVPVQARVVVDAGGYRAAFAKAAGLHPGFTRFGVGAEYELAAAACSQTEAVLAVGNDFAPAGYAWVFPWGGDRVRVGVGVHHADVRDSPKELLDAFMLQADRFGVDLTGATRGEYHFGLVPTDGMPARLVGDGVMAVGDAACQATLVVGEGIRLAMTAGWMAGTVAARALAAGATTKDALLPYEREFRKQYALDLRIGGIMNRRLAASTDTDWDEKVRLIESLPKDLVPGLLQSEFRVLRLLRWTLAKPRSWHVLWRYAVAPRLNAFRG